MSKVSIVVPCYKVEKYIEDNIESLQRQTFKDIEIILIDDGSPDNTGAICDEYALRDSRLRVVHKLNEGVSAARNDGLKIATGEYVIFADSDDYLPKDAIELLYTKAIDSGSDIVIGDINQVFPQEEKMGRFFSKEFDVSNRDQISELVKTVLYRTYCPWPFEGSAAFGYGSPCNKLVRRKMLMENHIEFDISVKGIYDDIIYSAYILSAAKTVSYIPQNVYNYRILNNSITRTFKNNMLEINKAIFDSWGRFLEKYNQDGAYTAPYYANVLRRFDESLGNYYFNPQNPDPIGKRIKDLQGVVDSEPYRSIVFNVEVNRLEKRHLQEYKLLKHRSALMIGLFYLALIKYRSIKAWCNKLNKVML